MKPLVFHFPDDDGLAQRLVGHLDVERGALEWHRFPDRESLVTLRGDCAGRDVVVICTLSDPDTKSLPLYFAACTARELGARRVGLVAPYLAYMRQDQRFLPGQSRSADAYAKFLSASFDWLVTVDPHLHRLGSLGEIFSIPAAAVSAMPAVSDWIRNHVQNPVLVGPDRESAQWAETVARSLGAPCIVLDKVRSGDRDVRVTAPDPTVVRRGNPVVIDDIASSGRTLAQVAKGLVALGVENLTCVIVHALFVDKADEAVLAAGARRIVSTNTVSHASNGIDVAPLMSSAIRQFLPQ
ncbi:MAG TPA: ribose-phosphate pyrophosphokinase [Gemmatimonadaceae bacterium]|nr:ribose-phosphate pyrophosphokinase [Gemmatimonadaceae bacterium]